MKAMLYANAEAATDHGLLLLSDLTCFLPVLLLLDVLLPLNPPPLSCLFRRGEGRLEGPRVLGHLSNEAPDGLLRGVLDLDDAKDAVEVPPAADASLDLPHPPADFAVAHPTVVGREGTGSALAAAADESTAHHHDAAAPLLGPLEGVSRSVSLSGRAPVVPDIPVVLGVDVGESETRKQLLDPALAGVPDGMSRQNLIDACWSVNFNLEIGKRRGWMKSWFDTEGRCTG